MRRRVVVDASVLAAWAFGEPRAGEAQALLADARLYAPSLLAYELASVARHKISRRPELRDAIADALHDALDLELTWCDVDQGAALELALAHGLTTYDAAYLTLARVVGAELVTFDAKLASAAGPGPPR